MINANGNSDSSGGDCVAGSGNDTITFSVSGTIITNDYGANDPAGLTIDGAGQNITLSGNNAARVLSVNGVLDLINLTVANGVAGFTGGGILNNGTLTVRNCTFLNNRARFGGGLHNNDDRTLSVSNSTFFGNIAINGGGGGINNDHTLSVTNSTFSGGSADDFWGGGIRSEGSSTTNLANTLIANSTGGGDCRVEGSFPTNLKNLIEDGTCSPTFSGGPMLDALADNGGPTQTFALLAGSAAIDAGDDTTCAAAPVSNLDQRGELRPQGAHCDIGSVEVMVTPSPDLAVSTTDSPDPVVVTDHLTYTIAVNNAGEGNATSVTLTDTLPSSVDFVSVTPSGSCSESGGTVECDLGNMASGAGVTVTIVVKPTAAGTITNNVSITSVEDDDNPGNNTDSEDTTVRELLCDGRAPTIVGTPGNDTLTGTNGPDVIHGLGGNDVISGGNDQDVICGGEGNDTLSGNNGIDRLFGENGNDTLNGNNGDDALDGGAATDTCNGGLGADTGANCETTTSIP